MRLTRLKNISNESIKVSLSNGVELSLPPDVGISNVDVMEVDSLRGRIELTEDLTEVNRATGKQRLLD